MDSVDFLTPVYSGWSDLISPYMWGRFNGLHCDHTYKEEVMFALKSKNFKPYSRNYRGIISDGHFER